MRSFFYGWYMKCQSGNQTLAVIPAVHQAGRVRTCSVQVITDTGAWAIPFSGSAFRKVGNTVLIGKNQFGEAGIRLAIDTQQLCIKGELDFGRLLPLKYDIMGPFALVPFLECRHLVFSMRHSVYGKLDINGKEYCFRNAQGYWEGDGGRSFPKEYAWTQCCFQGGCLMLAVADIPLAGLHFTGVIGSILWKGREYRLATYLGARAVRVRGRKICIAQGEWEFEAWLPDVQGHPLKAPVCGNMVRTIHESAASPVFYRFREGKSVLFEFWTNQASFEYEYPAAFKKQKN